MQWRGIVVTVVGLIAIGGASWFAYTKFYLAAPSLLFKTQKPERRNIHKIVHAEGILEAKETAKIGSLITGRVKKIHVTEGQAVTAGTVLAELANDKGGDTEVRRAEAQLEQAEATLAYIGAQHKREKALYDEGLIAAETYEKSLEAYQKACAEVKGAQATYDKELFLLKQTHIRAPCDGTVIAVNVEEGEIVTPEMSSPSSLFEMAGDLTVMKATLFIDESKIGDIKVGMHTDISVDTYPDKHLWRGPIKSLGLTSATIPSACVQAGSASPVAYKATI